MPATAARPATDRRDHASRQRLLRRIVAEFAEMPCLRLTRPQARRLFDLRDDVCERVLRALVADGALSRSDDGRYGLGHVARPPLAAAPRPYRRL